MNKISIPVDQGLVDELLESFQDGPIVDNDGRRLLTEFLVKNVDGMTIYINADEHPPPHFHVSIRDRMRVFQLWIALGCRALKVLNDLIAIFGDGTKNIEAC